MLKSYYALSDKGPYFNNNQDAFYANLEYRVFGVVDGFGGTGIGDLVSANIIKSTHDVFSKSTMDRDATLKFFYDSRRSVECNFLINGILSFHENLMQENEQKSLYQRGAANCIFVIDQGQRVSVISVGKIYGLLIRDMMLKNLAVVDEGIGAEITDAIAVAESWTKSAIGLFSPLQFFINDFSLRPGDQLLLASQGALYHITPQNLCQCLQDPSDKLALEELLRRANDLGNRANQTAVLLRY